MVHAIGLTAFLASAASVGFISFLVSYSVDQGIDQGAAGPAAGGGEPVRGGVAASRWARVPTAAGRTRCGR